jgi:HD superfamily phosphodiesterase
MDKLIDIGNTFIIQFFPDLDSKLDSFVSIICKDRDISHGYGHMWKISRLAIYIAITESITDNIILHDILIIGWLHDVADHKYDLDNHLVIQLKNFLQKEFNNKAQYYIDIIQRISFSKELKYGSSDWLDIFGNTGLIVRNIVSDADKIDALGESGLRRCIEFGFYKYSNASKYDMIKRVRDHANNKILLLKDNFIRTITARNIAEQEHNILLNLLSNLDDFFTKNYY